ncbi:hypothetical protein SAMD00019534_108920, partial [Acytostelium subglobosum LB1]|uniref:hypothetical protein n=1 Tax=Acytostelium subglobosum LB1 TaxID=1410327 RepID=UPI000644ECB8
MSMLRTIIARSSALKPRLSTSQSFSAFVIRGDKIKDREDALETEYVKMKEKDDLRRMKEVMNAKEKEESEKKNKEKVKVSQEQRENEIKTLERQIEELNDKLEALQKKKKN